MEVVRAEDDGGGPVVPPRFPSYHADVQGFLYLSERLQGDVGSQARQSLQGCGEGLHELSLRLNASLASRDRLEAEAALLAEATLRLEDQVHVE